MQIHFTEEERQYFSYTGIDERIIADNCPPEVRKSIKEKFAF